MKNKDVAVLLVLLAAVLVVVPAAAQAEKIDFTIVECGLAILDPGTMWVTGDNVLHFRDQITLNAEYSDEPLASGTNTVTRNGDINLSTGKTHIYGSFNFQVAGFDGAWVGSFTARGEPDGSFRGKATAQGTGELSGMTFKLRFSPLPSDYPNNPCTGEGVAGLHSGYIIDRRN